MAYPYNGLHLDEIEGIYFDRSLELLLDTGVTTHCAAVPCKQPHLAIPLGDEDPIVESFSTSGLQFHNEEGVLVQDRKTVFDRVC